MRVRLCTVLLAVAALLSIPGPAAAATPASKVLIVHQGTALAQVQSLETVPRGFSSSARQAMAAAEHSPILLALHRRLRPLEVIPYVWRSQDPYWYVEFHYHAKLVGVAAVSRSGKLTGAWTGLQAQALFAHGHWASVLTTWMLLVPASLLFMLPFLDPRRLRRVAHLDALAVLAFLISYVLLAGAHLIPAVWLAYPPLIYLLLRLLNVGLGRERDVARIAPLLGMRVLAVGLPLMLMARIAVSLLGHQEIDVGYDSVVGAFRILHHLPLYYNDPNHGDTYGPMTYLAYVPFQLLLPWKNSLSSLHAADAAAIVFDLGTIAALVLLGRQLRPGREGTRLGLVLAWAWAACPFTVIGLVVHTNDGLISMLTVFAILALRSPLLSGGVLGLAAAAKFSPAALLPLVAAPRQRGLRGVLACVLAFVAIVVTAVLSWLPPRGLGYFWKRTIGFQLHRVDVFSPWALHPSLHPLQTALEVLAVLLLVAVAFFPRDRSLLRVCALAGAVTIAIQLPATHWYYYYIMWFLPFALVAFLVPPTTPPRSDEAAGEHELEPLASTKPVTEPALAGV